MVGEQGEGGRSGSAGPNGFSGQQGAPGLKGDGGLPGLLGKRIIFQTWKFTFTGKEHVKINSQRILMHGVNISLPSNNFTIAYIIF